jgi:hypothetical protein
MLNDKFQTATEDLVDPLFITMSQFLPKSDDVNHEISKN